MNATEFGLCILLVIILTGAVLQSIAAIYRATVALAEWIDAAFFHKAGTQERE